MPSATRYENKSLNNTPSFCRCYLSVYMKCIICILILYYVNLLFGYNRYMWSEKSFEDEYHLTMIPIDVTRIEENVEAVLGTPKNVLSNQFLIKNQYLCGRSLDPETLIHPHVLIFVKSDCENFQERQAIRMTWGFKSRLTPMSIQLAFVLGTDAHNTSVEYESKTYEDIIQIDKLDYYYYNAYKMVMMLRWIAEYCSSKSRRAPHIDLRKYVFFVEDDYHVDIDALLLYINSIDNDGEMTTYERRTFLTGELVEKSRPQRFVNDRWYVSIIDYPYDIYPPYISTGCFLMTRYNARLFYIASKYTRLFYFDYVYMGLLSYSMSTNLIANNELFSTNVLSKKSHNDESDLLSKWKTLFRYNVKTNTVKKPICYRGYRAQKLLNFWNEIHQTNLSFSSNSAQ